MLTAPVFVVAMLVAPVPELFKFSIPVPFGLIVRLSSVTVEMVYEPLLPKFRVPPLPPIFIVLLAVLPKLIVVAVASTSPKVVEGVVIEVVIAGEVILGDALKTATPVPPVSFEIDAARFADVMEVPNTLPVPVTTSLFAVRSERVTLPVPLSITMFPDALFPKFSVCLFVVERTPPPVR